MLCKCLWGPIQHGYFLYLPVLKLLILVEESDFSHPVKKERTFHGGELRAFFLPKSCPVLITFPI